jgi:dynein heavy chain
VLSLFEEYVDDILERIRGKAWKETITTMDTQLVVGLCNLFEAFISDKFGFKATLTPDFKKRFINYSFAFAVIWSLGASIEETHHDAMNDFIRYRF